MKYNLQKREIPSRIKVKCKEGILYFYKNGEVVILPNEDGQIILKMSKPQIIRFIRYLNTAVVDYMELYD
ncbi:MAG: hypothetical protein ACP5U0_07475 [Caldisphaera sp.]